mmetsp:Transcript_28789/g.73365  ORF Transcript_28789/g.73365 Transcript_28789/m.73365 type:complete len:392 (-) Transcript_28789:659-1834(-)
MHTGRMAYCGMPSAAAARARGSLHLHDARGHQLVELAHDVGRLEVVLRRLGVLLEVAQHVLHHGVLQDVLHVGVRHGARLPLLDLLRAGVARREARDGADAALDALLQLLVVGVVLEPRVVRLHRLLVLLAQELQRALAAVALGERGRQLDALVGHLDTVRVRAQLGVARRQVGVELVRFGVHGGRPALERLVVVRHRLGVARLLERGVALVLLLVAQRHVDVLALALVLQRLLRVVQLLERVRVAVLRQRLVEHGDRLLQPLQLGQRRPLARHGLGHQLVVGAQLAPALHRLVAVLHALVILPRLEEHGGAVGEERDVAVVQLQRLVVVGDGLIKALGLVRLVARLLLLQRRRLAARVHVHLGRLRRLSGCGRGLVRLRRLRLGRIRLAA